MNAPHNTYWVVPGQLLAGEYPGDKEETEAVLKIKNLLSHGVDCFIDLTESGEHGLVPYAPLIPKASDFSDVVYKRMPIRDVGVPSNRIEMINILNAIDEAIGKGKVVYLHCWGGVGRTGTVVGCYFARHGFVGEQAIAELRRACGACDKPRVRESPETQEQYDYILDWKE